METFINILSVSPVSLSVVLGFLSAAGNTVGILNIFRRLYDTYVNNSQDEETRQRAIQCLNALPRLSNAVAEMNKVGLQVKALFETAQVPFSINTAHMVHRSLADTFTVTADVLATLHELAGQARNLEKFDFLETRIRKSDPALYDLVKLLSRSYEKNVLSLDGFPTYFALYGPKRPLGEEKIKNVMLEMEPFMEKVTSFVDENHKIIRGDRQLMVKSFNRLMKETSKLKAPNATVSDALAQTAPDWIRVMSAERLHDLFNKKNKGFRN